MRAVDGAGNIGDVGVSGSFTFDATPPELPTLLEATQPMFANASDVKIMMQALVSTDAESPIVSAAASLGSSPGADDILSFQPVNLTAQLMWPLAGRNSSEVDAAYARLSSYGINPLPVHVSFTVTNAAGLVSNFSVEVVLDLTPPVFTAARAPIRFVEIDPSALAESVSAALASAVLDNDNRGNETSSGNGNASTNATSLPSMAVDSLSILPVPRFQSIRSSLAFGFYPAADPESSFIVYRYCVGSAPYACDVVKSTKYEAPLAAVSQLVSSSQLDADALLNETAALNATAVLNETAVVLDAVPMDANVTLDANGTADASTFSAQDAPVMLLLTGLNLPNEATVYVTVAATNAAGGTSFVTSQPLFIDSTCPGTSVEVAAVMVDVHPSASPIVGAAPINGTLADQPAHNDTSGEDETYATSGSMTNMTSDGALAFSNSTAMPNFTRSATSNSDAGYGGAELMNALRGLAMNASSTSDIDFTGTLTTMRFALAPFEDVSGISHVEVAVVQQADRRAARSARELKASTAATRDAPSNRTIAARTPSPFNSTLAESLANLVDAVNNFSALANGTDLVAEVVSSLTIDSSAFPFSQSTIAGDLAPSARYLGGTVVKPWATVWSAPRGQTVNRTDSLLLNVQELSLKPGCVYFGVARIYNQAGLYAEVVSDGVVADLDDGVPLFGNVSVHTASQDAFSHDYLTEYNPYGGVALAAAMYGRVDANASAALEAVLTQSRSSRVNMTFLLETNATTAAAAVPETPAYVLTSNDTLAATWLHVADPFVQQPSRVLRLALGCEDVDGFTNDDANVRDAVTGVVYPRLAHQSLAPVAGYMWSVQLVSLPVDGSSNASSSESVSENATRSQLDVMMPAISMDRGPFSPCCMHAANFMLPYQARLLDDGTSLPAHMALLSSQSVGELGQTLAITESSAGGIWVAAANTTAVTILPLHHREGVRTHVSLPPACLSPSVMGVRMPVGNNASTNESSSGVFLVQCGEDEGTSSLWLTIRVHSTGHAVSNSLRRPSFDAEESLFGAMEERVSVVSSELGASGASMLTLLPIGLSGQQLHVSVTDSTLEALVCNGTEVATSGECEHAASVTLPVQAVHAQSEQWEGESINSESRC
ncbi:MAG: hypothetical protein EOO65_01170 [Methanosarcinales archaeon]|nr:MAG: hypothetical protein EOO65_01170 [Methanosarcinales archaeon]